MICARFRSLNCLFMKTGSKSAALFSRFSLILSFISWALLLVKVTMIILSMSIPSSIIIDITLFTRTIVFPEPAAADTIIFLSLSKIALFWPWVSLSSLIFSLQIFYGEIFVHIPKPKGVNNLVKLTYTLVIAIGTGRVILIFSQRF